MFLPALISLKLEMVIPNENFSRLPLISFGETLHKK
jgi:hypothetical protein